MEGLPKGNNGTAVCIRAVPEVKQQILEMTLNGSGIRDIARVLPISPTTVMEELKKRAAAPTCQRFSHPTYGSSRDPR